MEKVKWANSLFLIYAITIITAIISKPYLRVHPSMTPNNNFIFLSINIIWMSFSLMSFISNYIKEKNVFQDSEKKKLTEINSIKNQFYTNISHEFRTPLTLIMGSANELKKETPEHLNLVNAILINSKKLLKLVNQMLNLAKIESSTIELNLRNIDVGQLLRYITSSYESLTHVRGIDLNTNCIDKIDADLDIEKFEQIIDNLLSNAIKNTSKGGHIDVILKIEDQEQLKGISQKPIFAVSIKDTGIGIPEDKIPYIFDKFYQISQTDASYLEGTGIGLSIVKQYMNMMNGNIELISKKNIGSTFKLLFPLHQDAPKIDIKSKIVPKNHEISCKEDDRLSQGDTILLVEDNIEMADFICFVLGKQFKLFHAENGRVGFELALKTVPDIIISDVMMPEMNGFELLKKLKSDQRTNHISVIMLTAKADLESKLIGLKFGADEYLPKPFNKKELILKIKNLIQKRNSIQKYYSKFPAHYFKKELPDNSDNFMNQIHKYLKKHIMEEEELEVTDLCKQMGMSRTQLYKKFKALTNSSIYKYLKQLKLYYAHHLLLNGSLNVTEVSFKLGFKNPAHFSNSFNEEFGIRPSELTKDLYSGTQK
jgi:signal transduction histidine kinase/DNA-binding response OmpR family regulator